MATDYSKNGNVRSLALSDSSMLTGLGNDLGCDRVFAKQIELHGDRTTLRHPRPSISASARERRRWTPAKRHTSSESCHPSGCRENP